MELQRPHKNAYGRQAVQVHHVRQVLHAERKSNQAQQAAPVLRSQVKEGAPVPCLPKEIHREV